MFRPFHLNSLVQFKALVWPVEDGSSLFELPHFLRQQKRTFGASLFCTKLHFYIAWFLIQDLTLNNPIAIMQAEKPMKER